MTKDRLGLKEEEIDHSAFSSGKEESMLQCFPYNFFSKCPASFKQMLTWAKRPWSLQLRMLAVLLQYPGSVSSTL